MTWIASSKTASDPRRAAATALAALAFAAVCLPAARTSAAEASIAEELFREGKALMKEGKLAAACPKLVESQRLDPASGTMLAVAVCHEKEGKIATAWTDYLEADSLARKDGSADRSKAARERAAALEPQLSRLELAVPEPLRELPGLQIRFDAMVIERAAWGTAMPVNPGEHVVEVTATGKEPWKTSVTIKPAGDRQRIELGPLVDAPPAPLTEPPAPPPSPRGASVVAPDGAGGESDAQGALIAGGVVGGLGLVALGVGTFFGVRALDQIGEAQDRCAPGACTDADAVTLNEDGRQSADLATGLIVGGAAVTVAGLVVILWAGLDGSEEAPAAPSTETARLSLTLPRPWAGPDGAGLLLGGSW